MGLKEAILAEMNKCEPYTAGELAEELDEPRRTVDYNLRQLVEADKVNRKEHAKQRVSWWRSGENR